MKKVAILAAENTIMSTIASPMDLLLQAGVLWNLTMGEAPNPLFDVKIVTADGKPFTALNKIPITPSCSMHDLTEIDLIIIPSQGFFYDVESTANDERVEWLKGWYNKGADLASICAGTFILASTGLLDGRKATTHWALATKFRELFPAVDLRVDLMVTEDDRLYCGGGISADADLALYLIEKYYGRDVALQSSRCTLVELDRTIQSPFSVFIPKKDHEDDEIIKAQEWIETNYHEGFTADTLAQVAKMSLRQFNRRFKSATNVTAVKYLQHVRVDASKMLLATTRETFDDISLSVGYENVSFFRRVFRKSVGLTPLDFRKKFGRLPNR